MQMRNRPLLGWNSKIDAGHFESAAPLFLHITRSHPINSGGEEVHHMKRHKKRGTPETDSNSRVVFKGIVTFVKSHKKSHNSGKIGYS